MMEALPGCNDISSPHTRALYRQSHTLYDRLDWDESELTSVGPPRLGQGLWHGSFPLGPGTYYRFSAALI
jgi:hypothetical protein